MTTDVDRDGFEPAMRAAITQVARIPQLLIACDYDGTLAPIVEDPSAAAPLPEAVAALRSLATLPQTTVAVVSGRALRDLAALSRLPAEVHLVGSHGSEFDVGFVTRLEPHLVELRGKLLAVLEKLASEHPGVKLEAKPASIAVHTRTASEEITESIMDKVRTGPAQWPDVHTTEGKEVIELSVLARHKGTAVEELRRQVSAGAVLFIGDDVTDENAFRILSGKDIGVKVGPGETAAQFRVADPLQAVRVLALLLETRRNWLFGERAVPIERHAMLADGKTVALVTPDARISWLCHPRADSAAIFADLLGGAPAGHFTVAPQRGGHPLGQRYRSGTMTVESRWSGLSVTDWLDGDHLLRRLSGHAVTVVEFAPRPEFGQVPVRLQELGDGLLVLGTSEQYCLYAKGVEWDVVNDGGHDVARAVIDLGAMGGEVLLDLRMRSQDLTPHLMDVAERLDRAELPWRDWSQTLSLPTIEPDLVMRSALTLKGLCHVDGGGVLAAATTSLPETLGGIRNWDYRFCWLRDGAMTVKALVDLGSLTEAEAFLRWVGVCVERTGGHPERLHPLYTVDGYELGPEAVIENLPGYAGSRPVRVGNAANKQLQLDVFGPVADVLMAVAERRGKVKYDEWRVLEAMVHAVAQRWHEPDHGLWEARLPPRHHVYSKVMCWMTVDRAIKILSRHTNDSSPEWELLRDRIAENVLTQGWHDGTNAYTVAYGSSEMDASSLWIGLSGLLPDDDPRFLATVLAVEAELRSGPTVYRYKWDDGMPGKEGGFHVCTSWLIEAYLRTGRRADAEELFEQLLATAGPTGLLPEQYDPDLERGLGNHPQAYSHLGLIRCAQLLSAK
ncbi:MAG TPA: trehalose-phosphatase [Candidatus Limnocylindrales bacterium]|nr:trehalose-phosphatase [Candidatus Limnocylindrales bacterium]